jgi:TnpA family transposase
MIVEAHAQLSLANVWCGGEVASVDGLRFVVPVRSINSGPNPRYFGVGRGVYVTWNWGLWYHWNIKRT